MFLSKKIFSRFLSQIKVLNNFSAKFTPSQYESTAISTLEGISALIMEESNFNVKMEKINKLLQSKNFSFINIRGKLLFEESFEDLKNIFNQAILDKDGDIIRILVNLERNYGIFNNHFDDSLQKLLEQNIEKDLFEFIIMNFAFLPKYRNFLKKEKNLLYYYAYSFDESYCYDIDIAAIDFLIKESKDEVKGLIIYSNFCKNLVTNNKAW
jgi:hypothetical protein